ncbi:MAG: phospholipase A [Dysgonomonas sp.]|nr:phospholipase A [uncultured Dysgonomonas sp.]MDU1890970.1 phospholipase A [Dysgonomonas sp.]
MNKFIKYILIFLLFPFTLFGQTQDSTAILNKEDNLADLFKRVTIYRSEKEILDAIDKIPPFGIYKDNFFITGIPLNQKITNNTADAMFQISIRHRLTKSILPFGTFAYLTYTQKSFWNIYAESSPFRDTNYNPGVGLAKVILHKNRLLGVAFIQIKHESNGREKEESRSWNYLSLAAKYYINPQFNISGEFWLPYVDGDNNKDLLDYKGLGQINVSLTDARQKWWLEMQLNQRKGFGNINTIASIAFKVSKSSNQYLFLRFQDGYGDSLLDYNKYSMNVRIGMCIKPDFYSIY